MNTNNLANHLSGQTEVSTPEKLTLTSNTAGEDLTARYEAPATSEAKPQVVETPALEEIKVGINLSDFLDEEPVAQVAETATELPTITRDGSSFRDNANWKEEEVSKPSLWERIKNNKTVKRVAKAIKRSVTLFPVRERYVPTGDPSVDNMNLLVENINDERSRENNEATEKLLKERKELGFFGRMKKGLRVLTPKKVIGEKIAEFERADAVAAQRALSQEKPVVKAPTGDEIIIDEVVTFSPIEPLQSTETVPALLSPSKEREQKVLELIERKNELQGQLEDCRAAIAADQEKKHSLAIASYKHLSALNAHLNVCRAEHLGFMYLDDNNISGQLRKMSQSNRERMSDLWITKKRLEITLNDSKELREQAKAKLTRSAHALRTTVAELSAFNNECQENGYDLDAETPRPTMNLDWDEMRKVAKSHSISAVDTSDVDANWGTDDVKTDKSAEIIQFPVVNRPKIRIPRMHILVAAFTAASALFGFGGDSGNEQKNSTDTTAPEGASHLVLAPEGDVITEVEETVAPAPVPMPSVEEEQATPKQPEVSRTRNYVTAPLHVETAAEREAVMLRIKAVLQTLETSSEISASTRYRVIRMMEDTNTYLNAADTSCGTGSKPAVCASPKEGTHSKVVSDGYLNEAEKMVGIAQ